MKKSTILAIAAMLSLGAQAQYTVNPSNSLVLDQKPSSMDYILLSDAAIKEFEDAGTKMNYIGPNEVNSFLYYWSNTLSNGDSSFPRVDMEEGGYASFVVGSAGWSGAGFCLNDPTNLGHLNEKTRFHLAYMTPTNNAPASICLVVLDGGDVKPAKVALGGAFEDAPAIAPKATTEWQGIDISFADLKKLYPSFNYAAADTFKGNVFSFLGGGVKGTTFAFDAIYFYNVGNSGVNDIEANGSKMVVTGHTINVPAGQGVELYNLGGQLVKSTNGCVLGLDDLQTGVYVAKSGREVRKIMVR